MGICTVPAAQGFGECLAAAGWETNSEETARAAVTRRHWWLRRHDETGVEANKGDEAMMFAVLWVQGRIQRFR
jgi:hypothetical protein